MFISFEINCKNENDEEKWGDSLHFFLDLIIFIIFN